MSGPKKQLRTKEVIVDVGRIKISWNEEMLNGKVEIDGVKLENVGSLSLHMEGGKRPLAAVTFLA